MEDILLEKIMREKIRLTGQFLDTKDKKDLYRLISTSDPHRKLLKLASDIKSMECRIFSDEIIECDLDVGNYDYIQPIILRAQPDNPFIFIRVNTIFNLPHLGYHKKRDSLYATVIHKDKLESHLYKTLEKVRAQDTSKNDKLDYVIEYLEEE